MWNHLVVMIQTVVPSKAYLQSVCIAGFLYFICIDTYPKKIAM
jgi:hypothetical protein